MKKRPDWNEYFMSLAFAIAERSTCLRRSVGAIAVKDKQILATGYNGAPTGYEHCIDSNECLRDRLQIPSGENTELCLGCHAEQNVICQAAKHGISLNNAELYCTTFPCVLCMKNILNAGFSKVYYRIDFEDHLNKKLAAKIECQKI